MRNIALIGFMGTGKTSVAKELAERLGKKYVGTDELIVKKIGKSVEKIFEEDEEKKFREMEIEACKEVAGMEDIVVDCGGGVVLNKINIDRLKKSCLIILLTTKPEIILKRCENSERPLLKVENKLEEIRKMLSSRKPFYEMAADYSIDTSETDVDDIVKKIIKIWEKNAGCNRKK